MIILAWPWALAALPLPLLARFLPAVGPGSGAALRLPSLQAAGALDLAGAPRHRRLGLILAWIAWNALRTGRALNLTNSNPHSSVPNVTCACIFCNDHVSHIARIIRI